MLIFAIFAIDNSFAQQDACDYKVEIIINNSEFESKDFSWRMKAVKIEGMPTNITGTAEIDDLSGQIIKKYKPWTNESISKQKTSNAYTPNLNQGEYKIISRIIVECNDINSDNNADVKIVKIKNSVEKISTATSQNNIQNDFVEDNVNNTIKSEKTNQSANYGQIENKTSRMRVSSLTTDSKNEPEKLIAPEDDNVIQLKNTYNKKFQNKLTADVVKKPETVYESSNEKAKNMIVMSLLVLSVLLNIVLIWRR